MHRDMIQNPHLDGEPFFLESGPVGVLLCHGFTATSAEVRPLANILYNAGYTVNAPLLPGHNTRPEDLNNSTWRDWLAVMEQAYTDLATRCDKIFVGGESTGGVLALLMGILHREITGLLTYAPALRLIASPIDQLKLRLLAPFLSYVKKNLSDDDMPWQGYPVIPLKGAVQLLNLQKIVLRRLEEIKQPTLIIQGRLDDSVRPDVPDLIAQKISSKIIEIHWMDQSSHVVILDKELESVANVTKNFIRRTLTALPDPTK
jgi:carboxylesterase